MKTNKPESGFVVGLIGMGGFFLAWLGLLILVEATVVLLGASMEMANGVAIAAALLFTGDTVRFRQMGHWVSKASRRRE